MKEIKELKNINFSRQLIDRNYTKGIFITPKYIVIHDTDNRDFGANAKFNRDYLSVNSKAKTSTHYIVDDKNIIQMLEDTWRGWHVGDGANEEITNSNSIAIKLCVNRNNNFNKTMINTFYLVKFLMQKYNIGYENVKMHFHVTGKLCPKIIIQENPAVWMDFINTIASDKDSLQFTTPILKGKILEVLTSLNVKEYPDRMSKTIGTINNEDEIFIYDELSEWYKIVYNGEETKFAYINRNYVNVEKIRSLKGIKKTKRKHVPNSDGLSSEKIKELAERLESNPGTKLINKRGIVYNIVNNLPIKEGPAAHFYVSGYLLPNDEIEIVEEFGNWYKIIYDTSKGKREGFVEKDNIKIKDE